MSSPPTGTRRKFIKTITFATVCSGLAGVESCEVLAAEIQPLSSSTLGTLRINLNNFPALLNESGSVRLGINPLRGGPPSGPTPDGAFYPVVINRGPNNTFYALNSRCPHQGCVVDPMFPGSDIVTCPCHGSLFSISGARLGGPTPSGLSRYTVTFDGKETLEVRIPSLNYSVTLFPSAADASGDSRLRMTFTALRNVGYEIYFRESLERPPTTIPFSMTPDGSLDQTLFTSTFNTTTNLYVARNSSAGFYQVGIRANEV